MENGTMLNSMMILGKTEGGLVICQDDRGELIFVEPKTEEQKAS